MPDRCALAERGPVVHIGRGLDLRTVHSRLLLPCHQGLALRMFPGPRRPRPGTCPDTATASRAYLPAVVSVVVPAHNEARVIGRLLGPLVSAVRPGDLDVIVVANGCTDDTAEVAAAFGPPVRVVSIPVASKRAALVAGDEAAQDFPRLYVDADVELGAEDVRALDEALRRSGALRPARGGCSR